MNTVTDASRLDRFKAFLQYPLPQHLLSRGMHWLTRRESPRWLIRLVMRLFVRGFKVNMAEAAEPDVRSYASFNAFFTRCLHPDARPLASEENAIVSPVDGTISQLGAIRDGRIFQAKGQSFSVLELLGGDAQRAAQFSDGSFSTIYLAPRDYHRIHMPLDGTLREMVHVPGRLFSVNPATTRAVPRLFARNERVAALFDTAHGPLAVVMVGALFVGSIATVWAGEVTPPANRKIRVWRHGPRDVQGEVELAKGEELGRFNMGSTVILLFGKDRMQWEKSLQADSVLRLGERIGTTK